MADVYISVQGRGIREGIFPSPLQKCLNTDDEDIYLKKKITETISFILFMNM